jgi:hypothetical protein
MKRHSVSIIESLESRTFLSVSLTSSGASGGLQTTSATVVTPPSIFGLTLHATAGTPFSGAVGFYATPVLDPPLGYFATINWGDGTVTQATLHYGTNCHQFGEVIDGVHTYVKAGTYAAKVTVYTAPINPKMAFATTILETIRDAVIVSLFPANSSNGVTIDESAGKSFTAKLGTFTDIAPATGLTATISWGDGTTSTGVIASTGVIGLDVIDFKVTGTHTYALAGKYAIHVVVTRPSPSASSPAFTVATIESTAVVAGASAAG